MGPPRTYGVDKKRQMKATKEGAQAPDASRLAEILLALGEEALLANPLDQPAADHLDNMCGKTNEGLLLVNPIIDPPITKPPMPTTE